MWVIRLVVWPCRAPHFSLPTFFLEKNCTSFDVHAISAYLTWASQAALSSRASSILLHYPIALVISQVEPYVSVHYERVLIPYLVVYPQPQHLANPNPPWPRRSTPPLHLPLLQPSIGTLQTKRLMKRQVRLLRRRTRLQKARGVTMRRSVSDAMDRHCYMIALANTVGQCSVRNKRRRGDNSSG